MTRRRWQPTDAHVDESQRGTRYVVACVVSDVRDHPRIRSDVIGLLRHGQRRIHFHDESLADKRRLLGWFAQLPVQLHLFAARVTHGSNSEHARQACLAELVRRTQAASVSRLVLESRGDDRLDARTIIRTRAPEPVFVFEHRRPGGEPLLWIADGMAWAGAMRGAELDRVAPIVRLDLEVSP